MTETYFSAQTTKLEYKDGGSYKQLKAATSIPEVGGTPDEISTDSLDNEKYHTSINGLQPALKMDIPFNLINPTIAESNIKAVYDMKEAGTEYEFRITYASGITVEFSSKVEYSFDARNVNELETFTLHLSAVGEPTITLPIESL